MVCENNLNLEEIMDNSPEIRGGCHFCLIKNDISLYLDILKKNDSLEFGQRKSIIGTYITNKHLISNETFSSLYSKLI